ARQFGATAVRNDTLRDTATAYLELVRAEHANRITQEAVENTQRLSDLTQQFAEVGQGLNSDYSRMQAELAIRRADLLAQQEAVQVASARLAQLLHADAGVLIATGEPTVAPLDILSAEEGTAVYVADGLLRRPELAEQKHLVSAAVERLRREQYAPLVPSVLLGLSYGAMGGGLGSQITNTGDRWDADAIAYWELRNLGFGEQAARRETASQARQARMRKVAILDQVAREVVEAHARVNQRRGRIAIAEEGIAAAEKSYRLNWERIENAQGLPIEVLQSVQALATARRTYLDAVIDYNVAQFQLCHATGMLVR
ncbi:MAG: TolC family protein, partial [Aureliella sp.]